jgi:hypothetical protein
MDRIQYVTETSQKRDVRCTTRTAGSGCLFGLHKRQNSVDLIRNMVMVKMGNEATVTYFTLPSRYSPTNEENHIGVSVAICTKYFHKKSVATRDIFTKSSPCLFRDVRKAQGQYLHTPGSVQHPLHRWLGRPKAVWMLCRRHLCPRRVSTADSPTYIPA